MPIIACMCNQPQRLAEALVPVRAALVAPPPVTRWGMGYVQGGEVLLSRTPRSTGEPLDLYPVIAGLKTDCLIGHVAVDDEALATESTQPFRFRRWMFAQDVAAGGSLTADVWTAIAERIPDFLRRNLKGRTASELSLHLLMAMVHDLGALDDPNLAGTTVRRAMADAQALLAAGLERAGSPVKLGNVATSNSRSLSVARIAGGLPVYLRRLHCYDDRGARDDSFRGVLVHATTQPPGDGAEEVPVGSVVTISRDLRVDIQPLS